MARKTARGRQRAARPTRAAARPTTRGRRKVTRASKPAARTKLGRRTAAARPEPRAADTERRLHGGETDQAVAQVVEEEEDLDWLGEDEDPRRQIVEDEDEPSPQREEEW